jgi:nitrogen fixation protein
MADRTVWYTGNSFNPFSAVHPCPKCGMMIQHVLRRGADRVEDMRTGGLHHCVKDELPEVPVAMECSCGAHILLKNGRRYDLSGQPHNHTAPAAQAPRPVAPRAQPAPAKGIMSEGITL